MKQREEKVKNGPRRLIAGLRVSERDLVLLAVVRPFCDGDSEAEIAHRIWRRGLEVTLAELVSAGVELPPGVLTEQQLAIVIHRHVQLCAPLLERAGLVVRSLMDEPQPMRDATLRVAVIEETAVDPLAGEAIERLGGTEFL
jgi:hypothetical protein